MSARSMQGFRDRVKLTLGLVAAYLVVLQSLHAVGHIREHARLRETTASQARLAADAVVAALGQSDIRRSLEAWRMRGVPPARPQVPRRLASTYGVVSAELLSPEGWGLETGASGSKPAGHSGHEPLPAEAGRLLALGDAWVDVNVSSSGDPAYATVKAYDPVLDDGARLLGVVAVEVAAEPLALSRREMLALLAIEGGSLAVFLGGLVFFTRWMLRPLELLQETVRQSGEAGEVPESLAGEDDTGFVIDTYRRMIGDLREKEQELRRLREVEKRRADELQDLNASLADSMVSGVMVLDLSGRIRSVNEAARETLALDEGRAMGRPFTDVLAHVPELHGRLKACLDDGLVLRRDEMRLNLAGVGRRDIGLTLSPLRDRSGSRTGAVCLITDLTEIKRLQEQVRLRESLAELGELSAGVAHEFRNSLATILGFATLVEKQGEGAVVEHGAAIHAEVAALRRVVDDFLRFANPTRLVIEPVNLAAIFEDLRSDAASRAGDKPFTLTVADGLPTVSGDETLLRRVFTNLVRNAVDAIAPGGKVAVSWERSAGEILVYVDDDGPGIPTADRERVFVPFFTRKEKGTGLGLALVRKVVVHHGGRVSIETSPLGGARFVVGLPARPDRAAGADAPAS